jgi:3alpha(or 20beta)-hydroxysteroid dehydrogenase
MTTDSWLRGEIVLVSGGAGGIGGAIAALFAAHHAEVMVADLDAERAAETACRIGDHADAVRLDVCSPDSWTEAVAATTARFGGPPTVLVHAAGVMRTGPVATALPADYQLTFDVNVLGAVHGIQAVIPAMRAAGKGSVIVVSSVLGAAVGAAGMSPYAASKAAVSALARCAAIELGPDGIRVNTLLPGTIDTPMSAGVRSDPENGTISRMPIARIGTSDEVAWAALYLASPRSAWVTGSQLVVDGGLLAGLPTPHRPPGRGPSCPTQVLSNTEGTNP